MQTKKRSHPKEAGLVKGKVILVGAGPGDPDLLTMRGKKVLEVADVVVYDRLVSNAIMELVHREARLIYAGKTPGKHTYSQDEINETLAREAREGNLVVRLKGGDPFIFGRGGEECVYLHERGIPFEVVPGISAQTGVTAYAGIPITHRHYSVGYMVLTGHEEPGKPSDEVQWDLAARFNGTIVVFMGVQNLRSITKTLLSYGKPPETPVAMIHQGTRAHQKAVVGTVADIADKAETSGIKHPALLVIGEVVKLREHLTWYEKKELFGRRIVVTRARAQSGPFINLLKDLGAETVEAPAIEIIPADDPRPMADAVAKLSEYDWIIFTSVNTVDFIMEAVRNAGGDSRSFSSCRIAAVGTATAAALEPHGLVPDLVPEKFVSNEVAEALIGKFEMKGARIFLPQADLARPNLAQALMAEGASVDNIVAYQTVPAKEIPNVDLSDIDAVTFTSTSTASNFINFVGCEAMQRFTEHGIVASIGPVTTEAIRALGVPVELEAEEHTIPGLADALVQYFSKRST